MNQDNFDDSPRFYCPHCRKRNKVPRGFDGGELFCRRCGESIAVPTAVVAPVGDTNPVIDGEQTLADLVGVKRTERRPVGNGRRNGTPWWLWMLHVAVPLAAIGFLAWYHHGKLWPADAPADALTPVAESTPEAESAATP